MGRDTSTVVFGQAANEAQKALFFLPPGKVTSDVARN